MDELIYQRPADYELEHEGDDDVAFFVALARRLKPKRVLELACGSGRVTEPLAKLAAREGFDMVGLDNAAEMLSEARRRYDEASQEVRDRLALVEGDMRHWSAAEKFDLIVSPCGSMAHLLTLQDQLDAWKQAHNNLNRGGRFVVDVPMPPMAAYADSFQVPPRAILEIDRDVTDPETGNRLIRYKTTRYLPHEQRAQVRFLYDKFAAGILSEHYVSDFESHVYFPRELQLLFMLAGFSIEWIYGDYRGRALSSTSQHMLMMGLKGSSGSNRLLGSQHR
jgi:SAM-dependent methyltransferase